MFTSEKYLGSTQRSCAQCLCHISWQGYAIPVTGSGTISCLSNGSMATKLHLPSVLGAQHCTRGKLTQGWAAQAWQGQPGSTGLHRLTGMQQSLQADREPWEAITYWEYPSFERRNMEMIKLNSKHAAVLLSCLAACDRHAVGIAPHCVQRQRVCWLSHLNLQGTEKRKGQ